MKQLNREDLQGVVRDVDEAGHLTRWLIASKAEMVETLINCDGDDFQHLQGQIITINRILDKRTDLS